MTNIESQPASRPCLYCGTLIPASTTPWQCEKCRIAKAEQPPWLERRWIDFWSFWTRAFDFRGRATRSQYWMWSVVTTVLIGLVGGVLVTLADGNSVSNWVATIILLVFVVYVIIAVVSFTVRRLHDVGQSGKLAFLLLLMLIPGVNAIFFFGWAIFCGFVPSQFDNKYGPRITWR